MLLIEYLYMKFGGVFAADNTGMKEERVKVSALLNE
jgi:hypothetical protein